MMYKYWIGQKVHKGKTQMNVLANPIYIYTHTHTHTHIYIYIHTHI